jgi:hypothetical protein
MCGGILRDWDCSCSSSWSRAGGKAAHKIEAMGIPAMLAVDDDPVVSAAVTPDLRRRFGMGNRIASPGTSRLGPGSARNDEWALITGHVPPDSAYWGRWAPRGAPCTVQTSLPGVLAAGDARLGFVTRVGSAVGEDTMPDCLVRRYPATI